MRRKGDARCHETTGSSTLVRDKRGGAERVLPRTSVLGWPGLAVYARGTAVASSSGGHSGWSRVLVTGKSTMRPRGASWLGALSKLTGGEGEPPRTPSPDDPGRQRYGPGASLLLAAALLWFRQAGRLVLFSAAVCRMASSGDFKSTAVHVIFA